MSHVRQRQRHEGAQTRSPREGELSSLTDLESRVSVAEVGHGQFWLVKAVRFIELGSPSIHEQSETRDKVGATNDKSTLAQATLTMSTTVAATTGLASAGHGSSARRLACEGGDQREEVACMRGLESHAPNGARRSWRWKAMWKAMIRQQGPRQSRQPEFASAGPWRQIRCHRRHRHFPTRRSHRLRLSIHGSRSPTAAAAG